MKTDGASKNDCEHNAAKRLYADTRREYSHLKLIVVKDALIKLAGIAVHELKYVHFLTSSYPPD